MALRGSTCNVGRSVQVTEDELRKQLGVAGFVWDVMIVRDSSGADKRYVCQSRNIAGMRLPSSCHYYLHHGSVNSCSANAHCLSTSAPVELLNAIATLSNSCDGPTLDHGHGRAQLQSEVWYSTAQHSPMVGDSTCIGGAMQEVLVALVL